MNSSSSVHKPNHYIITLRTLELAGETENKQNWKAGVISPAKVSFLGEGKTPELLFVKEEMSLV